jgi:hypothetical protein
MISQVKQSLYETLERLDDDKARLLLVCAKSLEQQDDKSALLKRLTRHPAIRVPDDETFAFPAVEPIQGGGIPASRLLIEDRR